MRFWDASALVPLLVNEPRSDRLRALGHQDPAVAVWWGTLVECTSALVRRERGGSITASARDSGLAALSASASLWLAVGPTAALREAALRAVRVHGLSAGDAFQLAAALEWAEGRSAGRVLVSLDGEVRSAAGNEGFTVLPELPA
ncbi:MAG TPA: type II toxin-antitoxin system VapC family toxin [Gemmatimonadales bacterium]|nr:type II toxin-antitoxin system VapC family toxin [Gemmatimonadales bacterium]